jgi:hypothetical protein
MTVKELYDDVLVEINKENAQSFTIEEFNYILNKAVNTWVNERYGFYAADQQLTDDLRVLIQEANIPVKDGSTVPVPGPEYNKISNSVIAFQSDPKKAVVKSLQDLEVNSGRYACSNYDGDIVVLGLITSIDTSVAFAPVVTFENALVDVPVGAALFKSVSPVVTKNDDMGDRYIEFDLPTSDYFHPLSCKVVWASKRRLIVNGHDVSSQKLIFPAKRLTFDLYDFIQNNTYLRPHPNRPYYQVFDSYLNSGHLPEGITTSKHQNTPKFKVFIGKPSDTLIPERVLVYTLKLPEKLTLYDDDIFVFGEDNSQIVEFPDYLKNEFVRRITMYLLEKEGNPRVQTQPQINQDIPPVPLNVQMQGSKQGTPETAQTRAQQQQTRQQ